MKEIIFTCFVLENVSVLDYFNVMSDLVYYQQKWLTYVLAWWIVNRYVCPGLTVNKTNEGKISTKSSQDSNYFSEIALIFVIIFTFF